MERRFSLAVPAFVVVAAAPCSLLLATALVLVSNAPVLAGNVLSDKACQRYIRVEAKSRSKCNDLLLKFGASGALKCKNVLKPTGCDPANSTEALLQLAYGANDQQGAPDQATGVADARSSKGQLRCQAAIGSGLSNYYAKLALGIVKKCILANRDGLECREEQRAGARKKLARLRVCEGVIQMDAGASSSTAQRQVILGPMQGHVVPQLGEGIVLAPGPIYGAPLMEIVEEHGHPHAERVTEYCGNNVVDPATEQCDGSSDGACPGRCNPPGPHDECRCREATTTTSTTTPSTTTTTTLPTCHIDLDCNTAPQDNDPDADCNWNTCSPGAPGADANGCLLNGAIEGQNSGCQDSWICTHDDKCTPSGTCQGVVDQDAHASCNPSAPDQDNDPDADCNWNTCSPGVLGADTNGCLLNGAVEGSGSPCNDGNVCTAPDACTPAGACSGTPIPDCP